MIYLIIPILVVILILLSVGKKSWEYINEMREAAGIGERTIFVIKNADSEAEGKIDAWLKENGWKKRKDWYSWVHMKNLVIYKLGFNFYRLDNDIVIQAWLGRPGNEQPLTTRWYYGEEPIVAPNSDEVRAQAEAEGIDYDELPRAIGQQAKDFYIDMLRTIIKINGSIKEENIVSIIS